MDAAEDAEPTAEETALPSLWKPDRALQNGFYDPLAIQIPRTPKGYGSHEGFVVWPKAEAEREGPRVMLLGNSSSIWPGHIWGIHAAQALKEQGLPITVLNGAVRAHSSAQELMRVIRDVPAIRPDAVVALSGICDAAGIVMRSDYPFAHRYGDALAKAVIDAGLAKGISFGAKDPRSWGRFWLDNHRFAAMICEDLDIPYKAILQPVLGVGAYQPTAEEQAIIDSKANKMLRTGLRYLAGLREFYGEVQEALRSEPRRYGHVVDLSDCLVGETGCFGDHRHLNTKGNALLGVAVSRVLGPMLRTA
ncbi:hypothetical protein SAMN02745194_03158 [Roseomonas rosea]|uniref:SGNH/GDSL hydrolase family protein n=2 Tax=Muricoccus roseus TaxID=198092 RepID=A0A1M6LFW8_9PROT|nr:hypothetical protein SAMN02745194_03158 [Roseomonas rosea]